MHAFASCQLLLDFSLHTGFSAPAPGPAEASQLRDMCFRAELVVEHEQGGQLDDDCDRCSNNNSAHFCSTPGCWSKLPACLQNLLARMLGCPPFFHQPNPPADQPVCLVCLWGSTKQSSPLHVTRCVLRRPAHCSDWLENYADVWPAGSSQPDHAAPAWLPWDDSMSDDSMSDASGDEQEQQGRGQQQPPAQG